MHILQNIVEDFVAESKLPMWFIARDLQGLDARDIYPDVIINNGDFTLTNEDLGIDLELFVDNEGELKAYDKDVRLVKNNHDNDPNTVTFDYEVLASHDVSAAIIEMLGETETEILKGLLKINDIVNMKERELCKR